MKRFVTEENKKWWTLAAVSVGLFMIMLDNTVVNVALPSMRASLHMTLSELEWVVAGYALTFAAFMLIGGKLADFVGRRLIFSIGLAVFTGASLACGLAPNGGFLIGVRVVQGLGGAHRRRLRRRGRRPRRIRAARAAPARADARPLVVPQPHVRRRERVDAVRRARDVRDVLLRLAVHAERARVLAGADGRELPP